MKNVKIFITGFAVVLVSSTAKGQSVSDKIPSTLVALIDSAEGQTVGRIQAVQEKYTLILTKVKTKVFKEERRARELLEKIGRLDEIPSALDLSGNLNTGGASYMPFLDSLGTTLKFIQQLGPTTARISQIKIIDDAKEYFDDAERLESQLRERIASLKLQLLANKKFKTVKRLSRSLDIYANEIQSYKAALNNPDILARKVFDELSKSRYFKDFFSRNSELSKYFLIPGQTENFQNAAVQGLQTNVSLEQMVFSRTGLTGQALKQQIQAPSPNVEQVIAQLKQILSKSINNQSEVVVPDYKPQNTGRRTIWNRLEYGVNIQGQRANIFPATLDVAVTIGYLISEKSVIGLGASYRLGLGEVFKNIEVSHQGIGFRSFADLKIKGSVFVSGGFELNQTGMSTVSAVPYVYNDWQRSGLLGLSRKFKIGNYAKSQVQILWDFLSYIQVPRAQPFLFRVGYSFNK